jgi:dTMP kinase
MDQTITRGCFITLEGIEGVGKSTQLKFIQRYLKQAKKPMVVTREPGGTPVAEAIRHLVLKQHEEQITPEAELLMLFAGRAQHIAHVVRPALDAGKWVICDRFTDATYAYQGAGRKMSLEQIATLEKWVQKDLQPDCIFLLDAPVKTAMKRVKRRGKADRIEAEQADFFERIRAAYLARAKQFPKRYKVIDASAPLLKVQRQIKLVLDSLIC